MASGGGEAQKPGVKSGQGKSSQEPSEDVEVVAQEVVEAVDAGPKHIYILHEDELEAERLQALAALPGAVLVPQSHPEQPAPDSRVYLYLPDQLIREVAHRGMAREWVVGILPHPGAKYAVAALGVEGSLQEVFEHYSHAPAIRADALMCNDELVFSSVVVGRVLALRPYDINRPQSRWQLFVGAVKGLRRLQLTSYTVTTGKEREIRLAALGMVVLGQTQSALVGRAFAEDLNIADGHVTMLALAPRSIISYLWILLRLMLPKKLRLSQLPGSLSLVQTDSLHISAPRGTEYLLDGVPVLTSELELRSLRERLLLLPGQELALHTEEAAIPSKETVRLNQVPVDAAARPLLDTHLPLFSHASEEEYRELFVALRDNAKASSSFQVLMVLSVLLALAGLYANSAPVIIGAMILAPLMSPIVSLAMGLARTDLQLIKSGLRTLGIGVAWGLLWAVIVAWIMPLDLPTAEMKARMSPTLLDLLIAVISGIAGAYAHSKEEIAKSLAGVAIAVALVPPLAVFGIGLGWADWSMAAGASLLLATNLVGIALAGGATFWVLGFAPFTRARPGMLISLVIMLAIAAPLTLSFSHLVSRQSIQQEVPTGSIGLSDLTVNISAVDVRLDEPPLIQIILSSEEHLTGEHVRELKALITQRVGQPIELEVQSNIRL